ncbi:MAG: enoyl-CoA hydratase/isomerase family protein [Sphingomonadaceae bacterium]|nr:enoyl-CoA hydratase/isomerase family protein [Sphingomonadaceae bacterium]
MDYTKLLYDMVGDVAFIRLNDPDVLNAMSTQLGKELLDALRRAEKEARAILIGSIGRAFCSGANLGDGGFDLDDPDRDAGWRLEQIFNPMILEMRASNLPIVTAVRGAAAGVGCGIACAADMVVAGEGAFFYQAFRHVGLTPDGGSTYLLSKAIGRVRAMEMMLMGTKLHAPQALEWGLINRVVADDQVDEEALKLATELAKGPRSLGFIKASAWAALESTLGEQLIRERDFQRKAGRTEDFVEGVRSFREKRPSAFKGR